MPRNLEGEWVVSSQGSKSCLIGIAGGTGSGKTTLCQKLLAAMPAGSMTVLYVDAYYRAQDDLSLEERFKTNYDHPDSLEFDLLIKHLETLLSGQPAKIPVYDFASHNRTSRVELAQPCPFIVVEGILSLYPSPLRDMYTLKIFVDAPADLRFTRRLGRDTVERGRSEESVRTQWETTVEPMHQLYCEKTKAWADMTVDGTDINDSLVAAVVRRIDTCTRAMRR